MSKKITPILCPQCGSADVSLEKDIIECSMCGAKSLVELSYEQTEQEASAKENCSKMQIVSSFSKDDFIRKSWIALAKEEAPIEVFEENFGEVIINDHEVLVDSVSVNVSYNASVGYNRSEPYIDYETYYENEPYVTTERYYDSSSRQYRDRTVTKYKRVQKQRQVTKYKTVVDWSPLSGNHCAESIAVVENLPGKFLHERLFETEFCALESDTIFPLPSNEAENINMDESAKKAANSEHIRTIRESVERSLPGDHSRDVNFEIESITEASSSIYKAEEYETVICFKGKTYSKHAFPFGTMSVDGDEIKNDLDSENVGRKMREELKERIKKRNDDIEEKVWKKTKTNTFISIGLFLLSCFASLVIHYQTFVVVSFLLAIGGHVFANFMEKKITKQIEDEVSSENSIDKSKTEKEIAEYATNYSLKMREALDKKLKSLGYKPVSSDEL